MYSSNKKKKKRIKEANKERGKNESTFILNSVW